MTAWSPLEAAEACPHDLCDVGRRRRRRLVLPYPLYVPAGLSQPAIGVEIPTPILSKLIFPPLSIGPRTRLMDGTRMPKATIDEYRYPGADENDIGAPTKTGYNLPIDAEAKP